MTITINSILMNNENIILHIIHSDFSTEQIDTLKEYEKHYVCKVNIYKPSDKIIRELIEARKFIQNYHVTFEAFFRLFSVDLLPNNINKVIYLDTDVIVNGKLDELEAININGYKFAAVPEEQNRLLNIKYKLGMNENDIYINSGVMIINLVELRKYVTSKYIINFIVNNSRRFTMSDQDMINMLWKNNILYIDSKYNCFCTVIPGYPIHNKSKEAIIYHYTTKYKPWLESSEEYYIYNLDIYEKYVCLLFQKNILNAIEYNREHNELYKDITNTDAENMVKIPYILTKENFEYYITKKCIKDIFSKLCDKKIAIYGNGSIGEALLETLKTMDYEVICIIDNYKSSNEDAFPPIIKSNQINEYNPDFIIVTPYNEFNNIRKELEKCILKEKIVSFIEILYKNIEIIE